jgi:hypothetical protein
VANLNAGTPRRFLNCSSLAIAALLIGISFTGIAPANAVFVESLAAGALINHFGNVASDLIDKGRDSGDFLVARLGIQLKDVVDAWKNANSDLLNDAFDKLDKQKQDFFRGIDREVEIILDGKEVTFDEVERLTGEWSTIISNMNFVGNSDPALLNYYPRVLTPEGRQSVSLIATGPNLAAAGATLDRGQNERVKPLANLDHQIQFPLKRADFSFPEDDVAAVNLTMNYREHPFKWYNPLTWFSRATARKDLVIQLLPKRLAKYDIQTRVKVDVRKVETRVVNLGHFQGRNSRIPRAVAAPDAALGWRIDLTRRSEIALVPGGGDQGRCEGIEDTSITENGLTMFARVDNRDQVWTTRDAWVDCAIRLPIYKIESEEQVGPHQIGDLRWEKDEKFSLPSNLTSMNVSVATFDQRSRIFTGAGSDKFFDLKVEGGLLVIRPRPPKDL